MSGKPKGEQPKGERIAKLMARAGLCSRRDAERWIADGRVAVDDAVLDGPAFNVVPGAKVEVDGKPLPEAGRTRLWRYHKPEGLVTSNRAEAGQTTVFEKLPKTLPRVVTVGRLDIASEGLLLLTNDGELARRLEHPETGWARRYRVRAYGRVDQAALAALAKGVTVDGVHYGPITAALERQTAANAWLTMTLREGKRHEVRLVLAHLGLDVNRLIRVSYGPFQLGGLKAGEVEEVAPKALREQLGQPAVAGQAIRNKAQGAARRRRAAMAQASKRSGGADRRRKT